MSSKTINNSSKKISSFGKRLKETFDNTSNQSIAEKLGVSKPALTAYMQGRIPPPDKLIEIAKLTQCNLNWLLTGEGTKNNTPQIERPQGIIIQGSKGGIGTSFSAVMIASNLALRGYGVLIADDVLHTCSRLILANKFSKSEGIRQKDKIDSFLDELYIPTRHQNLDFFIPSFWKKRDYPEEIIKRFNFDFSEINKRYQFVIFDVQKMENPFSYPHYSFIETFSLEPILRNAQVLATYQPLVSFADTVESILRYVEEQKKIYPDADFLGAFLINRWKPLKKERVDFKEAVNELKEVVGSKLFNTEVEYHKELIVKYEEVEKKIFSRKTKIFQNFSQLTDEILYKLDINRGN
jgi:transcriptional regulator with XRE-family HTH domain